MILDCPPLMASSEGPDRNKVSMVGILEREVSSPRYATDGLGVTNNSKNCFLKYTSLAVGTGRRLGHFDQKADGKRQVMSLVMGIGDQEQSTVVCRIIELKLRPLFWRGSVIQ